MWALLVAVSALIHLFGRHRKPSQPHTPILNHLVDLAVSTVIRTYLRVSRRIYGQNKMQSKCLIPAQVHHKHAFHGNIIMK
jgi:hypothetical protein